MYFRDLSIGASDSVRMPPPHEQAEFNFSAHAVQEIFLTFMPRGYVLDGTAKTNIILGRDTTWSGYHAAGDINVYVIEEFDFQKYFELDTRGRAAMLLDVLEHALLDIAQRANADAEPVRLAIAQTRACEGQRKMLVPKLSKSTPSRAFKLNVFRQIKARCEDWGIDVTDRESRCVRTEMIAIDKPYFETFYSYKKSVIKGDHFIIYGRLQHIEYKLNVKLLERKLLAGQGVAPTPASEGGRREVGPKSKV